MAEIYNSESNTLLNGTSGDDDIRNGSYAIGLSFEGGSNVTINAGAGNDLIFNLGSNVIIEGGAGNDSIASWGESLATINGGDGDDSIETDYGENLSINGGAGNDFMTNYCWNSIIEGGAGNDSIENYSGDASTLNGGEGDDTISNSGENVLFVYHAGDGNDVIEGFYSNSTLQIASGTVDLAYTDDKDTFLQIGEEQIVLKGLSSLENISIINASGEVESLAVFKAVTGTEAGDHLNGKENYLVLAQGGDDTISNKDSNVTIVGGAGNDSIYSEKSDVSISGGAGNDTIFNKTSYLSTTIETVNKTVKVAQPIYETRTVQEEYYEDEYAYVDVPYDVIERYEVRPGDWRTRLVTKYRKQYQRVGFKDTPSYRTVTKQIQVGTTTVDSVVTSQVVVPVTIQTYNTNSTINGGTGDDYIVNEAANFVYSYTVGDGNDTIVGFNETSKLNISGGDYTASISGNDIILKVGDGSITLTETKGKVLNINGKEVFKTDWMLNGTTAIYGNGLETFIAVDGVKSLDGISLSGSTITVSNAALNAKKVTVSDGYSLALGSDVTNPATSKAWSLSKTTATYKQTTSAGYTLADNAVNYSAKSAKTLATVKGVKSLDGISLSGSTITVSNAALNKKKVTVSDGYSLALGSDVTNPSTKAAAWTFNKTTATYKDSYKSAGYTLAGDSKSISYSKATSAATLATVKGAKSAKGLSVSGKKITLKNSALSDKVTVGGGYEFDFASDYKKATITGSKNSDTITARGKNLSINGGAGSDTIKLLGSTTTVTGGKGADVFVYGAGKNVITDYAADDKISVGAAISKTTLSGSNVVFTVGKGSLTVKNGKGKTLNLIDSTGKKYSTVVGGNTLTLTDSATSPVTVDSSIKVINASSRTSAVKITGNALDNKISGGAGNDTLVGGAGNDSLWGNAGGDNFIYSSGDDVIFGFDNKDTLTLDNSEFTSTYRSKDKCIALNFGVGSVTLKDFTATTFHINNDTYKISGSKFKKQ